MLAIGIHPKLEARVGHDSLSQNYQIVEAGVASQNPHQLSVVGDSALKLDGRHALLNYLAGSNEVGSSINDSRKPEDAGHAAELIGTVLVIVLAVLDGGSVRDSVDFHGSNQQACGQSVLGNWRFDCQLVLLWVDGLVVLQISWINDVH